jgi:hypothetical protein
MVLARRGSLRYDKGCEPLIPTPEGIPDTALRGDVAAGPRLNKFWASQLSFKPTTPFQASCEGPGGWGRVGQGTMIKIIIDAVLFSCMGAFITGVVVAANYLW